MENIQEGGTKSLVTTKKIDILSQFKKINTIYDELKYSEYQQLINLTNINNVVKNIDKYSKLLKNKPKLSSIINQFYNLVAVEYFKESSLEISVKINSIYNKNMAIIPENKSISQFINKISNSNQFDIIKLNTSKDKNYDNVVIVPDVSIYQKYPTLYTFSTLPLTIKYILLGLNNLNNKGNMMIHLKITLSYPLLEQMLNLLSHLFKRIELETLNLNTHSLILHCMNCDKKKYEKLQPELEPLLSVLEKHVINESYFPDIIRETGNKLFYSISGKVKTGFKMPSILYQLKVNIPESSKSTKITKLIEDKFITCQSENNYKLSLYSPFNDDKISSILESTIYDYVNSLVEFMEKHRIPYNKYYLSLIDDYYEHIITNIYSFSNNVNVQIINYPVAKKSVSMKRSKSRTKMSRKSRTKSIKSHRDYLHHISDKDEPYTYDGFTPFVKKLEYIKQTRRELMKNPNLDKLSKRRVTRVVEDFTRGISLYLHKRYKLDIIPSNAFTKLWEIYHHFKLVPNKKNIRMFHLAEAPGQFIKATEYYIKKNCPKNENYLWKANSLNPFNKEVTKEYGNALFRDDYGLIKKFKRNWIWGKDDTGDITRSHNVRWYRDYLNKWSKEPIDVVTGDGGLELDRQTVELQKLDYGQFLLAAATSSMGKHCVIKTFTPFMGNKPETFEAGGFFVGLLYLYSLLYREVYLFKPYTSRPTSGEYYIVGKGFMGLPDFALNKLLEILDNFTLNQTFFKKSVIPNSFVKQTYKFIEEMSEFNAQTIDRQNFFFSCALDKDTKSVVKEKTNCEYYLEPDNLDPINQARYRKWIKLFNFR